jgi:ribosomal protein S12
MATTKKTKTSKVVTAPASSPFKRGVATITKSRGLDGFAIIKGVNRKGMPDVRWSVVKD